jgi:hypothetical protein
MSQAAYPVEAPVAGRVVATHLILSQGVQSSGDLDGASPIPLQHGLPGTVKVQVERVAPAILVLWAAGKLLAHLVAVGKSERRMEE